MGEHKCLNCSVGLSRVSGLFNGGRNPQKELRWTGVKAPASTRQNEHQPCCCPDPPRCSPVFLLLSNAVYCTQILEQARELLYHNCCSPAQCRLDSRKVTRVKPTRTHFPYQIRQKLRNTTILASQLHAYRLPTAPTHHVCKDLA